jgi:hypothetical protein
MFNDDDDDFTTLDARTVVASVRQSSSSSSIKYKALLHGCSSIPRSKPFSTRTTETGDEFAMFVPLLDPRDCMPLLS